MSNCRIWNAEKTVRVGPMTPPRLDFQQARPLITVPPFFSQTKPDRFGSNTCRFPPARSPRRPDIQMMDHRIRKHHEKQNADRGVRHSEKIEILITAVDLNRSVAGHRC